MTFKQSVLVSSLILLSFSSPVLALDPSPTVTPAPTSTPVTKKGLWNQWQERRQEVKSELKEERQEVKTQIKELKSDATGTITADKNQYRKNKLVASQNGLVNSFEVRFTALQRYQQKIQERLNTKKSRPTPVSKPQNLTDAQAKLNSITALITAYNTDLAKYKADIAALNTSTDPKASTTALKQQAKKINEDLKAIHRTLVEALRLFVQSK